MLRLAALLALIALPLCSSDLTGRWEATLSSNGKAIPLFLEFQQDTNGVTGAVGRRGDFVSPLARVRLDGDVLTFEMRMPMAPVAAFQGIVDGDRISGQLDSELPIWSGKVQIKRVGPPARLPASLAPAAGTDDLAGLSDEFEEPDALPRWKNLSQSEGWPDRIDHMDVDASSAGHLCVVPQSGAWWAGYHGVYLFKEVSGDFVVTARVKVTGRNGGEPAMVWTISGLLARAPASLDIPREQREENWIYVMTGRGPHQARVIDVKSTVDGSNQWDITPASEGWHDLRVGRVGPLFVVFCRPDGGEWVLRKRIIREDLPRTLQVGINVTSDFKLSASMPAARYNANLFPGQSSPDSLTRFDFVRFSRPAMTLELAHRLAGKAVVAVNDADLFALFR